MNLDDLMLSFSTSDQQASMNDFEDRLILVRPVEEIDVRGRDDPMKTFAATRVHVIEITDAQGGYVDHGDGIPCFWSFVRRQLREESTVDAPWVLGRPRRGNRAFILRSATPADRDAARRAVARLSAEQGAAPDASSREAI